MSPLRTKRHFAVIKSNNMAHARQIPSEVAPEDAEQSNNRAAVGILMLTIFLDLLGLGVVIPFGPHMK